VMALVDTNCDPDPIDHVIACNDDALKSIKLILQTLAQTIIDRKNEMQVFAAKEGEEELEDKFEEALTASTEEQSEKTTEE